MGEDERGKDHRDQSDEGKHKALSEKDGREGYSDEEYSHAPRHLASTRRVLSPYREVKGSARFSEKR